jgi:membrane associated rhomboid family serine protease
MQELELTVTRALKFYWLFFWRAVIGGALIGAVVGFVVGFIMGIAGFAMQQITVVTSIMGLIIGVVWSVIVLKMAFKKRYSDFRIALVPRDTP